MYRHIRNYYLSNSKTFQDGNGNPGKSIQITVKMGIGIDGERGDCGRQDSNGNGN